MKLCWAEIVVMEEAGAGLTDETAEALCEKIEDDIQYFLSSMNAKYRGTAAFSLRD